MSNRITALAVHGILLHYILNYIHVIVVLFSNYYQDVQYTCMLYINAISINFNPPFARPVYIMVLLGLKNGRHTS